MHIPDGYLSPSTCGALFVAAVPVWATAGRRVSRVVKSRYVPLLAVAAAYCFVVMMLNVPIPGGTTAHAVGGVLVAILLDQWAAVIAVSTAVAIQALFFGDGGVLSFGANAFNMAIVMPIVGYGVYRGIAGGHSLDSPRRALAAGIGGYVGLNASAMMAAIEFGIQPALFHTADGTPLYAPFRFGQAIPAMALAHLTVAGAAEFLLTSGVVVYLQRSNIALLRINSRNLPRPIANPIGNTVSQGNPGPLPYSTGSLPKLRWFLGPLLALTALTPLGLLAPGGAFGEASPAHLELGAYGLAAVPEGIRRYAGFWRNSVLPGYRFKSDSHPQLTYFLSALLGVAAIALLVGVAYLIVAALRRFTASRHSGDGSPESTAGA